MKLVEVKELLSKNPDAKVGFETPAGGRIPAHAHVTEVARIDKRFVDCGGTFRTEAFCRLQTWFADDVEHRLTAGKLLRILQKAAVFLATDQIEVDVEYEAGVITYSPVHSASIHEGEIVFKLEERRTACLAMEKCLPQPEILKFKPIQMEHFQPRLDANKGD